MEETLNESITESTSVPSTEGTEAEGGNSFTDDSNPFAGNGSGGFGGGVFGDPLAPDEGYEYNFGEDSGLPMRTPFDQLLEFEEFNNLGDIFGNLDPSDNPFAVGSSPTGDAPSTEEDNAFEGDNNNSFDFSNPNTDGSSFADSDDVENETTEGVENMFFGGGGSMMNADFSGMDTGTGNTDNGNGNWFYGNDNQANGNGNWSFGDGNQIEGNGNWNLNEEGGTPFDSIFQGENNPLTGGNPLGVGEEGVPTDGIGGNNPIFAGGSTTPTPFGEGEIPDTAENPTGNQNAINGNGNWNFGSDNTISGNGNWNFGDGNVVNDGNGNWNLGDSNEVNGNGNRPSGSDNSIIGNSNRVTGDDNTISGNRFSLDENDLNILGNGDRYLQTDVDGNVSLLGDESASDSNYTFNFDNVVEASDEVDELSQENDSMGQDMIDWIYESVNSLGTGSLPGSEEAVDDAAGIFPVGEVPDDISPDVLAFS